MFIELKDTLINLEQVSNVGFLHNKGRIVFNFSHSIELETNKVWSTIADYRYFTASSEEEYNEKKKEVQDVLSSLGFINSTRGNHYWVNKSKVSYITTDGHKNRLIFNLSTSITKNTTKGISLINDFVFWDYSSVDDFNKGMLETQLKLKGNS